MADGSEWLDSSVHEGYQFCRFPKHDGELWTDVVEKDRPYVEWLVSGEHDLEIDDYLYDTLMELLEG